MFDYERWQDYMPAQERGANGDGILPGQAGPDDRYRSANGRVADAGSAHSRDGLPLAMYE